MAGTTDSGVGFLAVFLVGGAGYLIGYLLYIGYKMVGNTRNVLMSRELPQRKLRKYDANDFYDEPDGFYVTLPNGEVRID